MTKQLHILLTLLLAMIFTSGGHRQQSRLLQERTKVLMVAKVQKMCLSQKMASLYIVPAVISLVFMVALITIAFIKTVLLKFLQLSETLLK